MTFLYAESIGCPAGAQKIGVTTTGPVDRVPIIGPPWKSSGGVPMATSPPGGAGQFLFVDVACWMPPMRPTFAAECPWAAQPASSGDDAGWAAVAGAPAIVSTAALSRPLAPRTSAPRRRRALWTSLIIDSPFPVRRPRAA